MGIDAKGRMTGSTATLSLATKAISISSATLNVTKNMVQPGDTSDFDPATGMIRIPNIPVSVETSFDVEGTFRLTETPADLLPMIYGSDPIPLIFKLTATDQYVAGDFHMTDFSSEHPYDDVVTFSCTLVPEGPFTVGNPPAGAPAAAPSGNTQTQV
jgi:predicted secreted protein